MYGRKMLKGYIKGKNDFLCCDFEKLISFRELLLPKIPKLFCRKNLVC